MYTDSQPYASRPAPREKDSGLEFASRLGATFLGALAALIIWSCLLRLYVEWEWQSFADRLHKASEQRIEKLKNPPPVKGKF